MPTKCRKRHSKGGVTMDYENQEWLDYWGMNDDDPYDPFGE